MTPYQIMLHGRIQYLKMIGCWATAQVFEKLLLETFK